MRQTYVDYVCTTLACQPLFQYISLSPRQYWEQLLYLDPSNYGGVLFQSSVPTEAPVDEPAPAAEDEYGGTDDDNDDDNDDSDDDGGRGKGKGRVAKSIQRMKAQKAQLQKKKKQQQRAARRHSDDDGDDDDSDGDGGSAADNKHDDDDNDAAMDLSDLDASEDERSGGKAKRSKAGRRVVDATLPSDDDGDGSGGSGGDDDDDQAEEAEKKRAAAAVALANQPPQVVSHWNLAEYLPERAEECFLVVIGQFVLKPLLESRQRRKREVEKGDGAPATAAAAATAAEGDDSDDEVRAGCVCGSVTVYVCVCVPVLKLHEFLKWCRHVW